MPEFTEEQKHYLRNVDKATIYVSSKRQHAQLWLTYRNKRGYNVISSWINLNDAVSAESIGKDMWPEWLHEARNARFLIFYTCPGESHHNGNLLEIGACLSNGGIVIHVGVTEGTQTGSGDLADFNYHPRFFRVVSLEDAFRMAAGEMPLPEK